MKRFLSEMKKLWRVWVILTAIVIVRLLTYTEPQILKLEEEIGQLALFIILLGLVWVYTIHVLSSKLRLILPDKLEKHSTTIRLAYRLLITLFATLLSLLFVELDFEFTQYLLLPVVSLGLLSVLVHEFLHVRAK